jgi:hypothetical protein
MMLKEKIEKDFQKALKEKKATEVSTLRMLKAAILNKEKEKRYKLVKEVPELNIEELKKESESSKEFERKSQLTDEEITDLVFSEIKKRKEAILEYEKGKRIDLAEKEKKEIEILQRYLPEQLSEEEIRKLAKEVVEKVGVKNMGKVMAQLMPKVKGKADGNLVSKIVKELLGSQND